MVRELPGILPCKEMYSFESLGSFSILTSVFGTYLGLQQLRHSDSWRRLRSLRTSKFEYTCLLYTRGWPDQAHVECGLLIRFFTLTKKKLFLELLKG